MPRSLLTYALCVAAAVVLLVSTSATAAQRVFIIDDPTIKPQFDHWICKRANEGPVVSGNVPACGPMPRVTEAQLRGSP